MKTNELHSVRLFPKISDRGQWEPLKSQTRLETFRNVVFEKAEKAMSEILPELSATRFMDFVRNGNRGRFENEYFSRRSRLESLVLAEALEYQGKYVDRIIDHIWAILNEPTWCLPAHTGLADPLPDFEVEHVDLFSAETSALLAQTLMLMEDELAAKSKNLVKRLRRTLIERAIVSLEDGRANKYWWMEGRNNWTPWICSNLLNASMSLLADDPARLNRYANILLPGMALYVEKYHDDGGCDEGPSYWTVSPARLLLFYESFYLACNGKTDIFENPKICRMGEFIADVWIEKNMFVPFADAAVCFIAPCGIIYKYAERVKSEKMRNFALSFYAENNSVSMGRPDMLCMLAELFWLPSEIKAVPREDFTAWYPVLQVTAGKHGRIFLAAKAGHNGENHNHNDVGQFMIAVDGRPLVIDLGRSEYTRFTFSERRYENFILNSFGHNVLSFDGCGQLPWKEHAASKVEFIESASGIRLNMELSGCYPPELGLKTYAREIIFDFDGSVRVTDKWESSKTLKPQLPLYTVSPIKDGIIDGKLRFSADFPYECRSFDVGDCCMRDGWGPTLWKTQFEIPSGKSASLAMCFDLLKTGV